MVGSGADFFTKAKSTGGVDSPPWGALILQRYVAHHLRRNMLRRNKLRRSTQRRCSLVTNGCFRASTLKGGEHFAHQNAHKQNAFAATTLRHSDDQGSAVELDGGFHAAQVLRHDAK